MKRIGVVGLGLNNPYFYAPLLREFDARVTHVWDYTLENAQAYADRFDCEPVRSIDDFPDVDGVLVDSRNCDHIPLGRRFMERGIPVFLEKPLSHSTQEALDFLGEAEGKAVFSASPLRLAPTYVKMMRDVEAVEEPVVRCHVTVYHTMEFFVKDPIKCWHDDPAQSGGMMVDIGIHAVELMNMFMKKPIASVTGVASRCFYHEARCPDNYAVTITYEDGSLGTISLLCATKRTDYSVEVLTPSHVFINNMDSEYTGLPEWNVDNAYGGFWGTIKAFVQMIDTGRPPVPPQETRRNFELLEKIERAMKRGR